MKKENLVVRNVRGKGEIFVGENVKHLIHKRAFINKIATDNEDVEPEPEGPEPEGSDVGTSESEPTEFDNQ